MGARKGQVTNPNMATPKAIARRIDGQRNRKLCAELGLPNVLSRHGPNTHAPLKLKGSMPMRQAAKMLPVLEAQLSAWEAANPAQYRALPWYEAREAYKAQKALGTVVQPQWWELGPVISDSFGDVNHKQFKELKQASARASAKPAKRTPKS